MSEYSRQCILELKTEEGFREMVSWIPEKHAKKNKYLRLKNANGEWENGWKVLQVCERKLSKEVHERSDDHKKQRKASDI